MKINNSIFILVLLLLTHLSFAQSVKRGRNEGTVFIPASNVMGNGNITANIDLGCLVSPEVFEASSRIGASIGIAGILQFNAQTSFINFNRLGPTEAHLQATIPGNDRLRFFGVALSGDLYLSTSLDTITEGTDATKPEYNPYPLFSVTADLDWLARPKQVPLKSYFRFTLADNPRLLFEYKQIALGAGLEWKLSRHSLFIDAGLAMYKEKNVPSSQQSGYDQKYAWISPGGRYRLRNRFSLLGNFKMTLYRDQNKNSSFNPEIVSINIKFEAPIIFRETDTEAIRTLVFMEKEKVDTQTDDFSQSSEGESSIRSKLENTMSVLAEEDETFDYKREKDDLIQRREEVESLMEKIEQLLQEDKE